MVNPSNGGFPPVEIVDIDEAVAHPADDVPTLEEHGAQALPAGAKLQPDGSVILALREPVTLTYRRAGEVKRESYETLQFRRLTGKSMRVVQAADRADMSVTAIAESTGIKFALMNLLFDAMDGSDVSAAGEVVAFFVQGGRKTGR